MPSLDYIEAAPAGCPARNFSYFEWTVWPVDDRARLIFKFFELSFNIANLGTLFILVQT